jgi:hypothetical protein
VSWPGSISAKPPIWRSAICLTGTVRTSAERQDAQRAAWSVPGVTEVENHLTIASQPGPPR